MKFVKKRTRGKVEDKIAKVIKSRKDDVQNELDSSDSDGNENNDEIDLSDDELKHDNLRIKQKKGKKRKLVLGMENGTAELALTCCQSSKHSAKRICVSFQTIACMQK